MARESKGITVTSIEHLLDGRVKIKTTLEAAFFARPEYMGGFDLASLEEGALISDGDSEALFAASRVCLAERAAVLCLERSEHSRHLLFQKLLKKNSDPLSANLALDFLEKTGRLSDRRYARAWLSERSLKKAEGRIRLEGELAKRGISREIIREALDEFFGDHSEEEACLAAARTALALGKTPEQTLRRLTRMGFSYRLIRRAMEEIML